MKRTVKICCIQNYEEARLAEELGADYLGFVSAMPSGPGPIPEDDIKRLIASVEDAAKTVLLTSLTEVSEIISQQRRIGAGVLQLCAHLSSQQMTELREELPEVKLMPVVHVNGPDAVEIAKEYASHSDMLLLDSGSPDSEVPVLGGTGLTHDWSVSAQIVREVNVPVFLAGGLNAENVQQAIREVNPAGVDICSGVRCEGVLSRARLLNYVTAIRELDG